MFPGWKGNQQNFGHWMEASFHRASKENPAIFAQFFPKFQNSISHDSLYRSFFNLNVLVQSTIDR